MEFQDSDSERRRAEIIEQSVCTASITIKQLQHEVHGELYLLLEPENQEISPPEMIKILEMSKIEAIRQMGAF